MNTTYIYGGFGSGRTTVAHGLGMTLPAGVAIYDESECKIPLSDWLGANQTTPSVIVIQHSYSSRTQVMLRAKRPGPLFEIACSKITG